MNKPIPLPKRALCDHKTATERSHTCPECEGILRRCCMSALGTSHRDGCPEVKG